MHPSNKKPNDSDWKPNNNNGRGQDFQYNTQQTTTRASQDGSRNTRYPKATTQLFRGCPTHPHAKQAAKLTNFSCHSGQQRRQHTTRSPQKFYLFRGINGRTREEEPTPFNPEDLLDWWEPNLCHMYQRAYPSRHYSLSLKMRSFKNFSENGCYIVPNPSIWNK